MKMTKHLLAAFGAAGLVAASGGAFAADTSASASATTDDSGVASTAPSQRTVSKQDLQLEKKIESKLDHDKQLKNDSLDATVAGGNVTLVGTVASDASKARAEKLVSAMKGVKNVDNQIQVSSDSVMAPGSSGAALPSQGSSDVAPSTQGATGASGSSDQGSTVRERTTRVEEHREVDVQKPSPRGSTPPSSSDQQMRNQTQGSTPSSSPADDTLPGSASPAPSGPSPTPLPSEPASPSRRSTDNPGTERLPSTPPAGSDVTPNGTGASPTPGAPLR
jgi:hypothetical protein